MRNLKINISILGNSGVGKTSLIHKYIYNSFDINTVSTLGMGFHYKKIKLNDDTIQICFVDTAGQERFRSVPMSYYKNINAHILLYDINDEESFNKMFDWFDDIIKYGDSNSLIFFAGNKIDLNHIRTVSFQELQNIIKNKYKNHILLPYTEISVKNDINIDTLMNLIINLCYNNKKYNVIEEDNNYIINKDTNLNASCCY